MSSSIAVSNLAAPQWARRPKTPETSSKDEDFPSLGSHNRRGGPSKKRSDQRNINDPWNTSSSSSGSYNQWKDRRESQFQNDTDTDGSHKRCELLYCFMNETVLWVLKETIFF